MIPKAELVLTPQYDYTCPLIHYIQQYICIAHEIGHLMDDVKRELDYGKWLDNWSYRIHAEIVLR